MIVSSVRSSRRDMPKYQMESGAMKMIEWLHVLTAFLRHELVQPGHIIEMQVRAVNHAPKGDWTYLALVSFARYLSQAPWRFHASSMRAPCIGKKAVAVAELALACRDGNGYYLGRQRLSGPSATSIMLRAAAICKVLSTSISSTSLCMAALAREWTVEEEELGFSSFGECKVSKSSQLRFLVFFMWFYVVLCCF